MRYLLNHGLDERGQQIGRDGVDNAEPELADQRVFILFGDFLDDGGLFQYPFGLSDDLAAQRRHGNFRPAAFEQRYAQFIFEFFDGDRQRRLGDEAGLGRMAKMFMSRDGDDIFKFGQSHKVIFAEFLTFSQTFKNSSLAPSQRARCASTVGRSSLSSRCATSRARSTSH